MPALVIVSGGQTGVDRAALTFARGHGIAIAGWCPRGGWAEDMPDPPGICRHFPELRETETADPAERTKRNVALAGRLLVLGRGGASSPGTALAIAEARALGRPVIVVELGSPAAEAEVADALAAGGCLNVAGPRESEALGIFADALALLEAARHRGAPGD